MEKRTFSLAFTIFLLVLSISLSTAEARINGIIPITIAGTSGPAGPTGATGDIGPTGPQGVAGTNGTNGSTGNNGTNGINGLNGTNGTNGAAGTNGTNGINGQDAPGMWMDNGSYLQPNASYGSNIELWGWIKSVNWSNVSIASSQLSDLATLAAATATTATNALSWASYANPNLIPLNIGADPNGSKVFAFGANWINYTATTGGFGFLGKIFSTDWSNVTITNSQITPANCTTGFAIQALGGGSLNCTSLAGGSGASTADAFVTIGHPSDLTAERSLNGGIGINVTDPGAKGEMFMNLTMQKRRRFYLDRGFTFGGVAATVANDSDGGFYLAGTAAARNSVPSGADNVFGLVNFTTGTTAAGQAGWMTDEDLLRFGGGLWKYEANIRTNNGTLGIGNSTAADNYTIDVGFIDKTNKTTDGVFFEYDNRSAFWQCVTRSNNVETRNAASTTHQVNSFYRLGIEVSPGGVSNFYINGTAQSGCANQAGAPTASGRETGIGFSIWKTTGLNHMYAYLDYIEAEMTYDRPK